VTKRLGARRIGMTSHLPAIHAFARLDRDNFRDGTIVPGRRQRDVDARGRIGFRPGVDTGTLDFLVRERTVSRLCEAAELIVRDFSANRERVRRILEDTASELESLPETVAAMPLPEAVMSAVQRT
jgi:hypothetical protein